MNFMNCSFLSPPPSSSKFDTSINPESPATGVETTGALGLAAFGKPFVDESLTTESAHSSAHVLAEDVTFQAEMDRVRRRLGSLLGCFSNPSPPASPRTMRRYATSGELSSDKGYHKVQYKSGELSSDKGYHKVIVDQYKVHTHKEGDFPDAEASSEDSTSSSEDLSSRTMPIEYLSTFLRALKTSAPDLQPASSEDSASSEDLSSTLTTPPPPPPSRSKASSEDSTSSEDLSSASSEDLSSQTFLEPLVELPEHCYDTSWFRLRFNSKTFATPDRLRQMLTDDKIRVTGQAWTSFRDGIQEYARMQDLKAGSLGGRTIYMAKKEYAAKYALWKRMDQEASKDMQEQFKTGTMSEDFLVAVSSWASRTNAPTPFRILATSPFVRNHQLIALEIETVPAGNNTTTAVVRAHCTRNRSDKTLATFEWLCSADDSPDDDWFYMRPAVMFIKDNREMMIQDKSWKWLN